MLVLTRRINQALVVGDGITDQSDPAGAIKFTVLGIKGSHVRIGIEVPDHVNVLREELFKKHEG